MLKLFLSIGIAASQFLNCLNANSTACLTCQPSYNLYKINCISLCGQGYISIAGNCTRSSSSLQFLNVDFTLVKLYNVSSIAGLKTSDGTPFLNPGNFIPTFDRGFYSDSVSNLVGTIAWIPAPDFSLRLFFRPLVTDGILLQVVNLNGDNFLKVYLQAGYYTADLQLTSQLDSSLSTFTKTSTSQSSTQGIWFNSYIGFWQSSGTDVSLRIKIGGNSITFTCPDSEIFISQISQWVLGDIYKLNTVQGFYYYLTAVNNASAALLPSLNPNLCDNSFYSVSSSCLPCDSTCDPRITCIDNTTCTLCYSSVCSSCNGYAYNECQTCDNGETEPFCCSLLCRICTLQSSCNVCVVGAFFYEGICLSYSPTGGLSPIATPLNSITLDSAFSGSYGGFRTGTNAGLYNPFINPEAVDPIPSKNRGLYFEENDYIVNGAVVFPHILSIAALIKPTSINSTVVLSVSNSFLISSLNPLFIGRFQTDDGLYHNYAIGSTSLYDTWSVISISISYSYPESTVAIFLNNIQINTTSVTGVMRVTTGTFLIGIESGAVLSGLMKGFTGFIYKVVYWNSQIYDFSLITFSICADSIQTGCLWDCNFTEYLDVNGVCGSCPNCTHGCVNNESCNLCLDPLCSICSDFGNTCTACVANAASPKTGCLCNTNTVHLEFSCPLCHTSCATCGDIYRNNCNSCLLASQVLVNGICYNGCPDGFKISSNQCISDGFLVISLRLYQQNEFGSIGNAGIGTSSSLTQDSNDPQPVPGRGYYFFSNSMISKTSSLIFTEFTLSMWLKIYIDGKILTKFNTIQISSQSGSLYFNFATSPLTTYQSNLTLPSTWSYYQVKCSITMDINLQIQIFYNTLIVDTLLTGTNEFFNDSRNGLEIGSNSGEGFQGFLWSIELVNNVVDVNDIISSCIGNCEICPIESVCPSECNYGFPTDNCAVPCANECAVCSSLQNCTKCLDIAELTGGICKCPGKFEWNSTVKRCYYPCFNTCGTCDHYNFQGCLTCTPGYYLFLDVCVDCSLGFIVQGSQCQRTQSLIFDLKLFTGLLTYNQTRRLGEQRELNQLAEPTFTYFDRGRYFNGNDSGILFVDSVILFYPEFSFELWVMPNANGVIISKQNSEKSETVFQVELVNNGIIVYILNDPFGSLNYSISETLKFYQWNYLKISLHSLGQSNYEIILHLNKNFSSTFALPPRSYIHDNRTSSLITIGCAHSNHEFLSFYKGFIYQISVYNMYISGLTNPMCLEDCVSCIPSGKCIPVCNITSYWLGGGYQNCSLCSSNCTNGCRDERRICSLCDDPLCGMCKNLDECDMCIEGASLNSTGSCACGERYVKSTYDCELCENGYIINNKCSKCKQRCLECNTTDCLLCSKNSYAEGADCLCNLGYNGNETCELVPFYVNPSVSNTNVIYLDFSDEISEQLITDDILIIINSHTIVYTLSQYTERRYALNMKLDITIIEGTLAKLSFTKPIISISNGILNVSEIDINLHNFTYKTQTELVKASKSLSTTTSTSATIGTASVSMVNPSPASLWSFVNTIQLIIFIYLSDIPLGERTSGFLLGLRKYNLFPNIFDYLNTQYGRPHNFLHADELGFTTNSVLMNVGQWISAFLFFVALYYIMRIISISLSKTRYEKSFFTIKLTEKCSDYKYGFFLRFWIQAYIEILVASLLAIYSSDLKQVGQALNFYLALILLIITTMTPIVAFYLGMRQSRAQIQPEQQNIENVKLWGTLFYEFKDDAGAAQSHFYTLFFIRRLVFILILFILKDYPIIQLCLCEIIMIGMFLLIFYMQPFSESVLNLSNCIAELGLAVIILLIGFNLFEIHESTKDIIDYLLIFVVNFIVSSQLLSSLYIFFRTVYLKIKSRRKAKVDVSDKEENEFKIFFHGPEESKIEDITVDNSHDMQKINVSPIISCESSINFDSRLKSRDEVYRGIEDYINSIHLK